MTDQGKWYFLAYMFICTALVPIVAVLVMFKIGIITEWSMNKRADRAIPQVFTVMVYATVCYLLMYQLKVTPLLSLAMLITTISVLIITIVTVFWKISAHSAGISGIIGMVAALQLKQPQENTLYVLLGSIILTGAVMTSRMILKVHTPLQVFLGFTLGVSISFISVYIFI